MRHGDLTANRETMGDLREIQLEPEMSPEVEFLFDYGSPFSYLANLQIEGFAKRNGAAVTYTPILLGAVLKATGNASPMTVPAKGRYMATELRRWAARYGVAFKPNPHGFMSNTLRLMRGAVAAQANGWFALYHRAIYRATWAESAEPWRRYAIARIIGKRRRPGDHANGRHRAPGGKGPIASEHRPGRRTRRVRSANVLRR
jgi:2-hydroxychromene-2-carboxylate isomerase